MTNPGPKLQLTDDEWRQKLIPGVASARLVGAQVVGGRPVLDALGR